jgi:cell wall-associated NlpC family hydrolase
MMQSRAYARSAEIVAFTFRTLTHPDRVQVFAADEWIATFTLGCYTVTLAGPERTFSETWRQGGETRRAAVTHAIWVRAAPGPVDDKIDERWLRLALAANEAGTPDAFGLAMQYLKDAPPIMAGDLRIAGDASYGPLQTDGTRQEGSDFNDYLGLRWLYPTEKPDPAEAHQKGCLDCSGYLRMVWGYRHHLPESGYVDTVPMSIEPRAGSTLPRRAFAMYEDAPGRILVENSGLQVVDLTRVDIGDFVFFDGASDDGPALDHVGMYLGVDEVGRHRFISSRKTPDGPTLGDRGGASLLDGDGHYAKAFRAVRRL